MDCFISGRSHALSSRMPPFFSPSSLSSSTKSTTERNSSTPVPLTIVDAAYSTAVKAAPSFRTSSCRVSRDDTSVLNHDRKSSLNFESSTERA